MPILITMVTPYLSIKIPDSGDRNAANKSVLRTVRLTSSRLRENSSIKVGNRFCGTNRVIELTKK